METNGDQTKEDGSRQELISDVSRGKALAEGAGSQGQLKEMGHTRLRFS